MPAFIDSLPEFLHSPIAHTILKVCLIICIGLLAIYVIRLVLKKQLHRLYPDALRVQVIIRMLTYILLFMLCTMVLQQFGIHMGTVIGAAGIFGVAIGFAAQTSIANIISGLFLTLEHPFDLNDFVRIGTTEGKVQAINLFATILCTSENNIIRIANEQVLKSSITNISAKKLRRYTTSINLVPQEDYQKVYATIKELASTASYLEQKKEPFIAIQEITGTYARVTIGVWTNQKQWGITLQQFLPELTAALNTRSVALASISICKHL